MTALHQHHYILLRHHDYCTITAPLQQDCYRLPRHYCTTPTALLHITAALLHYYCIITTALLHITTALLHHSNTMTTDYYDITAPLLYHYNRITTDYSRASITAPLHQYFYIQLRHYCTITTTLLQITSELLHQGLFIAFITMSILRITSIPIDPLLVLHYYCSLTTT